MSLETYRHKRDFLFTPEPRGRKGKSRTAALRFVIQKHAARRLHYDFRLEWDGALKSWAIPKGPSLDPKVKRLAVHVEDHPLEYGDFEGVIPAGQYGAGPVLVWDHGNWVPDGDPERSYRKGHLRFTLQGDKLQGGWHLVRLPDADRNGKQQWLLIKAHDALAGRGDPVSERPESVLSGRAIEGLGKPDTKHAAANAPRASARPAKRATTRTALPQQLVAQLATEVDTVPQAAHWLHEIKYDGYRILCRVKNGKAVLLSRNGKDWTARFATLAAAVEKLGLREAWLDGEVVVWGRDGVTHFQSLQRSLRGESNTALTYCLFDLLYQDGEDLTARPLLERKRALAELLRTTRGKHSVLRYSDHVQGDGTAFIEAACRLGLEGVISKRGDLGYRPGRSREWVKIKCRHQQEFVIGGYTAPQGTRKGFGALLLGVYDASGVLRYSGRVGTGFTEQRLAELRKSLGARATTRSPFAATPALHASTAHWVRPELVAQVRFSEWTDDGLARQATFLGLREDKPPRQVRRETAAPLTEAMRAMPKQAVPAANDAATVTVRGVRLTHPAKILYPEQGVSKRELAEYYDAIADWLMPQLRGRPLSLVRCPEGRQRNCFYQKHAMAGLAESVQRITLPEKDGGSAVYLMAETPQAVIALVQAGVLELHTWGARSDRIEAPDRLIFDLDPDPSLPWSAVMSAAREVRARLADLELPALLKTTGGKGLHVVVPLVRRYDWSEAQAFARAFAEDMTRQDGARYTARMAKAARHGKIFIDWLRNTRGATAIAAYSTRARPGATVSVPLDWKELGPRLRPDQYTVRTLPARLSRLRHDPWHDYEKLRSSLNARARRELGVAVKR